MSRFYVGQRVRIVASTNALMARFVGMEGRCARACNCGCCGFVVDSVGEPFVWVPDHLVPILDPGLEACDEEFKRDLDKLLERQGVAA